MAKTKMTREQQIEAIEEVAHIVGGEVRSDYSGRCMFGDVCYGIVCDSDSECIEEAAALGLRGARVDSMGRRVIVYWESIEGEEKAA